MEQIISSNPVLFNAPMQELQRYIESKRWYELGESLVTLLSLDETIGFRGLIFDSIVKGVSLQIDPFHFARITLLVSEEISDPVAAIDFIESVLGSHVLDEAPYPNTLVALRIAELNTRLGCFEKALAQLNEIERRISDSTPLVVRSSFHRAQANLDKASGDYDRFYEHAFLFLSTSGVSDDALLAYDLCIAALFSSNICSFGELAAHPVLSSLENGEYSWLRELILLLDRGNSSSIIEFNEKFAPIIQQKEPFSQHFNMIQQKLALAVFLEIIFSRPFDSRVFSFDEIAEGCHMEKDNVELLVMKALSSGIIKGVIDEIEEKITVTWCKPKALSKPRLIHLKEEIDRWIKIVHQQKIALEERAQPIIG